MGLNRVPKVIGGKYSVMATEIYNQVIGHATQAITALGHGMAVFCQKPLGRSAAEHASRQARDIFDALGCLDGRSAVAGHAPRPRSGD